MEALQTRQVSANRVREKNIQCFTFNVWALLWLASNEEGVRQKDISLFYTKNKIFIFFDEAFCQFQSNNLNSSYREEKGVFDIRFALVSSEYIFEIYAYPSSRISNMTYLDLNTRHLLNANKMLLTLSPIKFLLFVIFIPRF